MKATTKIKAIVIQFGLSIARSYPVDGVRLSTLEALHCPRARCPEGGKIQKFVAVYGMARTFLFGGHAGGGGRGQAGATPRACVPHAIGLHASAAHETRDRRSMVSAQALQKIPPGVGIEAPTPCLPWDAGWGCRWRSGTAREVPDKYQRRSNFS
jgi:hypothetical protein